MTSSVGRETPCDILDGGGGVTATGKVEGRIGGEGGDPIPLAEHVADKELRVRLGVEVVEAAHFGHHVRVGSVHYRPLDPSSFRVLHSAVVRRYHNGKLADGRVPGGVVGHVDHLIVSPTSCFFYFSI